MAWTPKYRIGFSEQAGIPKGKPGYVQKEWRADILEDGWTRNKLTLNGSTGKITVPDFGFNPANPFTFTGWVNLNDMTSSGLIMKQDSGEELVIAFGGSDTLLCLIRNTSTTDYIGRFTPALTAYENEDLRIVIQFDGGTSASGITIRVYQADGTLVGSDTTDSLSGTYTGTTNSSSDIVIGDRASQGAAGHLDGECWDFRLHNKVLDADELQKVEDGYRSGIGVEVFNLIIDEGTGTDIANSAPESSNGVLSGGYTWGTGDGNVPYILEGTANPLTVQYDGSGNDANGVIDETSVIKPSRAVLNVYSTQDQYSDLWDTTGMFNHKMLVYEDDVLYHAGFVNADKWTEEWTDAKFPIQIISTDGLEKLSEIEYPTGTSRVTLKQVVINCIDQLGGLDLSYWSQQPFYDEDTFSTSNQLWDHVTYDQDVFRTDPYTWAYDGANGFKDCYEVLFSVLNEWNLRIFQRKGYWMVIQISSVSSSGISGKIYDETGVFDSNPSALPLVTLSGASTSDPVIYQGKVQIIKPLKKLTLSYAGFPAINYFAGGEFDQHVWDDTGDFNSSAWNKSGSITIEETSSSLSDDSADQTNKGCKITSIGPSVGSADYIVNHGQRVKGGDTFWYQLRFRTYISSGSGTLPQVGYRLTLTQEDGTVEYYNGATWGGVSQIIWTDVDESLHNEWGRIEDTMLIDNDGILKLHLYEIVDGGYTSTGVMWDRCICENTETDSFAFKTYGGSTDLESYSFTIENSLDYIETMEMNIEHSDRATYGRARYQDASPSYVKINIKEAVLISGASIQIDISGVTQTYTYVSSGYSFMSDDFTTVADLIAEIKYDDGLDEYIIWEETAGGSNKYLFIEARDPDAAMDFGTITHGNSDTSTVTQTDAVTPTVLPTHQQISDVVEVSSSAQFGTWEANESPHLEALGKILMTNRSKPLSKLKGKIIDYTKELDVGSVIYDPHGDRYYWINHFLVSCKKADINIEAIEINSTLNGTLTATKTII